MNLLSGSFRIGSLFGINIRVHFLFLLFVAFRLYSSKDFQFTGLFMAMLFGIILMHEFGHCFGARWVGGDAKDIMLWPLGGLAFAYAPMRPWPQFVTVAAGPLVNVVFCLLSAAYILAVFAAHGLNGFEALSLNPLSYTPIPLNTPAGLGYVAMFYDVNLFLLAFNLLPIYPLDGGQLFQTMLWPFIGLHRATMLACQVGLAGCALLGFWGITGGGGGILLFIAMFGGFTCWQRLQALKYGMVVEDPDYRVRSPRQPGGGFFSRLFKRSPRRPAPPTRTVNPNPGGWEAKKADESRREAELDRILKKVSEQGINSLSYVEQQMLRQATQQRQKEERKFERQNRP